MQKYDITVKLPEGWQSESETYLDESGVEITHFEAHLYDSVGSKDRGLIEIYAGDMPDGTTAEDQAFSNYADIVGFDDDDPEDFNPIVKWKFNNRNAYGFDALCEDDSPLRFFTQEPSKGVLVIYCIAGADEKQLAAVLELVERNARVTLKK